MSYEIVSSIKLNRNDNKIIVTSCSNNVKPRLYNEWEMKHVPEWWRKANGYEADSVGGKRKVVMRKSRNVLKANGLSYDNFALGNEEVMDTSTYKHIKAVNALSYIRIHDKDFLVNDIDWGDTLCYIGLDDMNGDVEIRKVDAVAMGANDIRVGTELLLFNTEKDANKFIKRYSESINMNELIYNYYRFDYEEY